MAIVTEIEDATVRHPHEQHRRAPLDVVAAFGEHRQARRGETGVHRDARRQRLVEAAGEHDRRLVGDLELHRDNRRDVSLHE